MSKTIPQPPGLPFVGNITTIDPEDTLQSIKLLTEQYGEIFKLTIFGKDRFFISSARLMEDACDEKKFCKAVSGPLEEVRNGIGDGLFTAYHGEHNWEIAHRTLVPAFGPIGIKGMYDEQYDITTQLVAKWARMSDEVVHVTDDFTRLALDSIGLCAMDKRFNSFYHEDMHPFVGAMVDFLVESGARSRKSRLEMFLNPGPTRKYEKDIALMRSVAREVIEHRRANPVEKKDLLNALLFGKDPKTGERLSDDNIMNNMITFLIAGHETTSGLLSYTCYHLLKNPDALRKAQAEVDKVVGRGPVKFEHMSKLPYLEAALRESLRLFPTAPAFTVQSLPTTKEPTILCGDYLIPPGVPIVCWLPQVGRDPDAFGEDAEEYRPDRMYGDNFAKLPKAAWKPFGNGARGCIGRPFAWQEAIMTLALVLQNFNLRMDDPSYQLKHKRTLTIKPDQFYMRATLRPGIDPVTLERSLHSGAVEETHKERQKLSHTLDTHGKPMTILYGSNAGTCEGLAQGLAATASGQGFSPSVKALDEVTEKFPTDGPVVIISASYEGNPPDNAAVFVEWLKGADKSSFDKAQIAVFGCGHRDWVATYQKVPTLIETELVKKGANKIVPRGETNVAGGTISDDFDAWSDQLWTALGSEPIDDNASGFDMEINTASRASHLRHSVQNALVVKNEILTQQAATAEKRYVEFKLPTGTEYEAGDYLAILPCNNVKTIDRVLRRFKLPWDATMKLKKGSHSTIPTETDLSVTAVLTTYVELTSSATKKNHTAISKYAGKGITIESTPEMSVLDILEKHPQIEIPFSVYLAMLQPMRIRQYSISSSPLVDPTIASITFSVIDADGRLGVATNYLRSLHPGSTVQLAVKKSQTSFHLPNDDDKSLIMICAGTGLAPFRGFVQERAAKIAAGKQLAGKALLFVGCRSPDSDMLHADELAEMERQGAVTLYYAFSRAPDRSEGCRYVQDRIERERELVGDMFADGARAYICGSARVGKAVSDLAAKLFVERKKTKQGVEITYDEGLQWWEGLRGERYAVDVFD